MLVAEEAVEIRVLRRQGNSIRAIARTLWDRTQRGALRIKILGLSSDCRRPDHRTTTSLR